MSDDQYLIQPAPKPEGTQLAQHPQDKRRANIAIGVAVLAVSLTGIQAWEAHTARVDAGNVLVAQAKDVERSRTSAENSADAAWASVNQLAGIVATGQEQIKTTERIFEVELLPSIGLDSPGFEWFASKTPRMDASQPTEVKMVLSNSGKTALGCQIKFGGKFSNPTATFDDNLIVVPAQMDWNTGGGVTFNARVPTPSSLSPTNGNVRLYLYGNVSCLKTLASRKPYHQNWCLYFPIAKSGDVVDDMHGCSEGVVDQSAKHSELHH